MIHAVAFDADDTLWENETFFREVEANVAELLADFCTPEAFAAALLQTERRNVPIYGYGIKSFTLCMLETAFAISHGKVPADTLDAITAAGRAMLRHRIDLIDGVEDTLAALSDHRLIVITKGDLFHQEQKIEASGLSRFFDAEHVVSEKNPATYARIFGEHAPRCVMVGNAPNSDIQPALDAGAWAIHVPHDLQWDLDHVDLAEDHPRYRRGTMRDVPGFVDEIERLLAG